MPHHAVAPASRLDLTQSNQCPTEIERRELQVRLAETTDVELAQSYTRILSPIRRVSFDVLLLMFSHAADVYEDWVDEQDQKAIEYPWVLSAVCTAWRSLILGTPTLWDKPQMIFGAPQWLTEDCMALRRDLQLSRSGSLPLELCVRSRTFAYDPAISDLLISAMPRMAALELDRVIPPSVQKFLHRPEGSCPALTSITITLPTHDQWDPVRGLDYNIAVFKGSSLRHVTLIAAQPNFIPTIAGITSGLPWRQLTVMNLGQATVSTPTAYAMIIFCGHLEELHLTLNNDEIDFDLVNRINVGGEPYSSLRKLILISAPHVALTILLNNLNLPGLTHLQGGWGGTDSPPDSQYAAITSCIARSSSPLTTFILKPSEAEALTHSGAKFLQFLRTLSPTLTKLECSDANLPSAFFAQLTSPEEGAASTHQGVLLPRLECLDIRCSDEEFQQFCGSEDIIGMVASRRKKPHASGQRECAILKRFHLRVTARSPLADLGARASEIDVRLSRYREEGLDLSVVYNEPQPLLALGCQCGGLYTDD